MTSRDKSQDLLINLRRSGDYSDLTIRCGTFEARVHKCIICPQSEFFRKACEPGKWKEGDSNVIDLKAADNDEDAIAEDDPHAVRLMIDYLYLKDYDPSVITARLPPDEVSDETRESIREKRNTEHPRYQEIVANEEVEVPADEDEVGPESAELHSSPIDPQEARASSAKKKKKKKKQAMIRDDQNPSTTELLYGAPIPTTSRNNSLLATNAKVYAIAVKYNIVPLMQAALRKFKSQSKDTWENQDLIAIIPIVFNQTAETEIEMRETLKVMIMENAQHLASDPGFSDAIEAVDGLAFNLFRRLSSVSCYQKICSWCGSAFLSKCASDGCRNSSLRTYNHSCDLKGPCHNCRQREKGL